MQVATNEKEDKKAFQTFKVQRFAMMFGFTDFQQEGPIFMSGNLTLPKHRQFGQVSAMHVSFFYKIWASLVFVEVIGISGIDFKVTSQWVPSREDKGKDILPLSQSTVEIKCCEL